MALAELEDAGPEGIDKVALSNGLRVVLAPDPRIPRVAVAVHYGVGFRSETPGREGFAHLFEHLMFRGSESLPSGELHRQVYCCGGEANGTTHQDYTDYYQVVPAAALERALFSEADRMRAPAFTPESVAEQLEAVEAEIGTNVRERPYGGFPWPLLPAVLYDSFANAHDGYGRIEVLRRTTPDDCAAFFDTYYSPASAVVTVVGGFDLDEADALVERHFGDIDPRSVPPPPELDEPAPAEDRWVSCSEPSVSLTALAVGYRLPDPAADLDAYLAHLVLGKLLMRQRLLAPTPVTVSSSCGFFGPLDARDPDTLVLTSLLPVDVEPGRVVEALAAWWAQAADGAAPERAVSETGQLLAAEHRREHTDPRARSRGLGRLELLFGRATLLDELPERIASVGPAQVAAAAAGLRDAAKAVLTIEPGAARTRPLGLEQAQRRAQPSLPGPVAARGAEGLARSAHGPRPVPRLGSGLPQPPLRWHGATLPQGLRVVGVRDTRAPLVEVRLRVPLGPANWAREGGADQLVSALRGKTLAAQRAMAVGGNLELGTDGQWLDVSGFVPPGALEDWLGVLAGVVTATGLDGSTAALRPPVPPDPGRLADDALRRRWLEGCADAAESPASEGGGLPASGPVLPGPSGACLVVVGDLDPSTLAARLAELASVWAATAGPGSTLPGTPPPGLVRLAPTGPLVHATVCAVEPVDGPGEAARYLATAMYGAHYGSRLIQQSTGKGVPGYVVLAGRDIMLDRPRAFLRASAPGQCAAGMVEDLRASIRGILERPPGRDELQRAREYCTGRLLSAFDSPRAVADRLRGLVASGRDPDWLSAAPDALSVVTRDEVAAAGAALFAAPMWGVAIGDADLGPALRAAGPAR